MVRIGEIKIRSIMTRAPITVDVGDTVSVAMAKLRRHGVRELPVMSGDTPVGLVSYTSFVERRSVPLTAKVDSIMLPVPRLKENDTVVDAAEVLVASGIRGAPVMRGKKMVGFVSRSDLISFMPRMDALANTKVREIMSGDPISVPPDEFVHRAQAIMEGLSEKALPVADSSGELVGVIGMTEVMEVIWAPKGDSPPRSPKPPRKTFDNRTQARIKVGSVMTRRPVKVSPDDTLHEVVRLMEDEGLSTLFVEEDNKLVGVVDQSDLMEQLLKLRRSDEVYVQISGLTAHTPDVLEGLHSLIGRGMKRISKIERPRVFYVHVTSHERSGSSAKYSLRARLSTGNAMYYVRNAGWDLFKVTSDLMESLETKVRREKRKSLDRKRR